MNKLITVKNIRGYITDDGTAMLNAEDVAMGWGFTQSKNGIKYVRWDRVNNYLSDFGYSPLVGKDDFLPENIVYRLGFKASNETAQNFQALLADEILPSIRKTGSYSVMPKDYPSALRALADEYEKNQKLLSENETMKPKADFYDTVTNSDKLLSMDKVAKILDMGIGRNNLYKILRENKWLMDNNVPYQKYVRLGYFKLIERTSKDADNNNHVYTVTLVKQKGLDKIRKPLEENGYRSKNTNIIGA